MSEHNNSQNNGGDRENGSYTQDAYRDNNNYNQYSRYNYYPMYNNFPPYPSPETAPPDKTERSRIRKLYNQVGGAMIAQYVLCVILTIAGLVFLGQYIGEDEFDPEGQRVIGFTEAAIMYTTPALASIAVFFVYSALKGIKPSSVFSTEKLSGAFIGKSVLAALFFHQIGLIAAYVVAYTLYFSGYEVPSVNYTLANDIPTLMTDLFTSIILAPIAEELFFRGLVLKETARVSGRFAIIFSALAFGLMHGNPSQAVMAASVGLVLGYVTIKSKSIIPAIVCHMTMNALVSVASAARYIDEKLETPVFFATCGAEFVIGLIGFVIIVKKDGIVLPPFNDYHKKRTMPIFITSACMIIIAVIYIADIIRAIEPVAEEAEEFAETAARIMAHVF